MIDACPECESTRIARCKCFRGDRICCDCAHRWHICPVHNTIVAGHIPHSIPFEPNVCTCNRQESVEITTS